jgi:hypothetical protein
MASSIRPLLLFVFFVFILVHFPDIHILLICV